MSAGGSSVSSRYASNSDVPGGVFRTHGDLRVPDPLTFAFAITSSLHPPENTVTIRLRCQVTPRRALALARPHADGCEAQRNVDQNQLRGILRLDAQRRLVPDLYRIAGGELLGADRRAALD